jgi:hypothetical protein
MVSDTLKTTQATRRFLETLPMRDIPAQHVVVEPLDSCDAANEEYA